MQKVDKQLLEMYQLDIRDIRQEKETLMNKYWELEREERKIRKWCRELKGRDKL